MKFSIQTLLAMVAIASLAVSCARQGQSNDTPASSTVSAVAREAGSPSVKLNLWFEEKFEQELARSPMYRTFLGRKTDYDKWDDVSDERAREDHALHMAALAEMRRTFDFAALDKDTQLSYRLFEYQAELADRRFPFRNHWYEFSQFRGPHSGMPSFLINQHRVSSLEDAQAYIARLNGVEVYLGQHQENAQAQYDAGITPPKWSFAQMIATSENVISGAPFDETDTPSTLLKDFEDKIEPLDIDNDTRADLRAQAIAAMRGSVLPAYQSLISTFMAQEANAPEDDGAWKLPKGNDYYALQLEAMTTTNMSAGDIHNLGLSEVARIHAEMDAIKDSVGFEGSLQDFFTYMREDPDGKFTYAQTDAGREAYLTDAIGLIEQMRERLDELFTTFPEAELIVKRVEPFRERAAGKAFYQRPAADGSRPGIYYANLFDMESMPTYQMEALAYHEGIPGHHMQIAISQELENMPSFRKYGSVTAYIEGWGLYSEYIPKEMGFYADPYSDFGRLAMELWRAARLVVDTGLHDKKWTRAEAISYLIENTPNPQADCTKAIERYIVMPGQATAYKIGMLKILSLRAEARETLGDKFDIREFHDVLLKDGPVPLAILEENVRAWSAQELAR